VRHVQLASLGSARGTSEVPVSSTCTRVQAYAVQSLKLEQASASMRLLLLGSCQSTAVVLHHGA